MSFTCHALPPVTQLYRDCAFAMLKAGKTEDCVTVCDNVFNECDKVDDATEMKNTGKVYLLIQQYFFGT